MPKADPSVLLPVPNVRQYAAYACGAAALQAILAYYGIDVRQDTLIRQLGTNEVDGTRYWEIVRVAKEYGLEPAIVSGFTIARLIAQIDKRVPVLIAAQAWIEKGDPRDIAAWLARKDDGHYLVAIGYDEHRIYFEDPAMFRIGYITFEELEARWHDYDQTGQRLDHFAILFKGDDHPAAAPPYVPID
jgi:ABC-type bacteriocin/lantibiotic exporter with double-glycine peptidase domain